MCQLVAKVFLKSLLLVIKAIKLAMCLLDTKVSVKSFTKGHLNICHQSVPFLSPNIPKLFNKVSWYILVLICFLLQISLSSS